MSLVLGKRKGGVLGGRTLLLLAVTKLIGGVLPVRKTGNFSNFSLVTSFWKFLPVNQKLGVDATLGLEEIGAVLDDDGPAEVPAAAVEVPAAAVP